MFATIKGLIPEPRQADQPRHYIGRHRHAPVLGLVRPRSGLADVVEPTRSFPPHKPALGIAPVAPAADGRTLDSQRPTDLGGQRLNDHGSQRHNDHGSQRLNDLGSQRLNDEERVAAGTDSRP